VHRQPEVRASLRFHLAQQGVDVSAEAGEGRGVLGLIRRYRPSLVILDAHLPDTDGLALAETIHRQTPLASIVIVGKTPDAVMLRRAMRAGTREFLVEPVESAELHDALTRLRTVLDLTPRQDVGRQGLVTVTASNKGGVGKTTVSTNLAAGLHTLTRAGVVLVDLDLDFGDVATVLDLKPARTIADLVPFADRLDQDLLDDFLATHRTGVKVLAAPRRGQEAEGISGELVSQVLGLLTEVHPYVVVDTGTALDDAVLAALDLADRVLLVTTMDIVSLKNIAQMLDLFQRLGYPLDRVRLLANRWNGKRTITIPDAEATLGLRITHTLPSDYRRVIDSINHGVPFISAAPGAPISRSMLAICRTVSLNGGP